MSISNRLKRAFSETCEEGESSPVLKRTRHAPESREEELTASAEHNQYPDNPSEFGCKVLVPGVSPTIE
jgi:hypothetical protein